MDDLSLLSDSILYFTAHTYAFLPHINDPLRQGQFFGGRMVYPNLVNMHSKRYDMYVDIVFEKLYAFWNRIGTAINFFLPNQLPNFKVNFPAMVDNIPSQFHNNKGYMWLKDFKENKFKEFNSYRKSIVHDVTTGIDFAHEHLSAGDERETLQRMMDTKHSYPNLFKEHMILMKDGLLNLNILLKEMDATYFSHIQ